MNLGIYLTVCWIFSVFVVNQKVLIVFVVVLSAAVPKEEKNEELIIWNDIRHVNFDK